jgi:hypothetical protein
MPAYGSSPLWGGALGAVLLAWSALTLLAPELGSVLAVFGSPLLAFFVIVRLLSGAGPARTALRGPTMSDLRRDPALLDRVRARSGGVCADCGSNGPLTLRPILPVGRRTMAIEHRFVALCADCDRARSWNGRSYTGRPG